MTATGPMPAEEPTYELSEGGSTLRVYPHTDATVDDLLTIEINGPADSVRLTWSDALELSDALRDAIGQGTFKEEVLRAAEKRGAEKATAETLMGGQRYVVVWALRRAAEDWRANAIPGDEDDVDFVVARQLDARADRIQAGGDR